MCYLSEFCQDLPPYSFNILLGFLASSARSNVDEVFVFTNPKMIIVNIWWIVLAPIIIHIVNTKSALIPEIILTN